MDRLGPAGAVGPLAIIALFALLDVVAGPDRVLLGLVVIAPLLAASLAGRGLTAGYAVLALAVAAALGVYDQQYTWDMWPTQAARLFGVALGGLFAVAACNARLEREERLQQMSAAAAAAGARATQVERTATLAEALQRSLLADPPRLPGLEVAVRYLPAAEHVKVGGDWYDAFGTPAERAVLVIGDVAGHDGDAAIVMAQVRSVVRGVAEVLAGSPAAVLAAVDRALRRFTRGGLATMIMAEVRTAGGPGAELELRWANAGHPPPLLVRADGSTRWLECGAELMLGVDPGARRTDHEVLLRAGDTVVLFTDGLVEQPGALIDDGLRRVAEAAGPARDQPLEALCDVLLGQVPDRPRDDTAVLAMRARGRPGG